MENIDRVYLINLERRPDRRQHFLEQCQKENILLDKVSRVQAIDGLTYTFNQNEINMFLQTDYLTKLICNHENANNIKKKIMGNQLSHYYILEEIVRNNYKTTIIFQDDSLLIPNFIKYIDNVVNNLPEDAEIINIGMHKRYEESYFERWEFNTETDDSNIISSQIVNDYICKLLPEWNPCSLAYIVTLQGAINLINYFNKYGFKSFTDINFNEYLLQKDIYYSSRTILVTGNPELKSDIFV